MAMQKWIATLTTLCLLLLTGTSRTAAGAQSTQAGPTTHTLTFANCNQTIDPQGRLVLVGLVTGDLPGVLTMALVVEPSGTVTSGEWALNVSYTQFGPPDPDGDGDPSEVLVQRGMLKGSILGGSAGLAHVGLAKALNGVQLKIKGATVEFPTKTTGTGTFNGSALGNSDSSNGTLTLTF